MAKAACRRLCKFFLGTLASMTAGHFFSFVEAQKLGVSPSSHHLTLFFFSHVFFFGFEGGQKDFLSTCAPKFEKQRPKARFSGQVWRRFCLRAFLSPRVHVVLSKRGAGPSGGFLLCKGQAEPPKMSGQLFPVGFFSLGSLPKIGSAWDPFEALWGTKFPKALARLHQHMPMCRLPQRRPSALLSCLIGIQSLHVNARELWVL